jgi:hypothetical protein
MREAIVGIRYNTDTATMVYGTATTWSVISVTPILTRRLWDATLQSPNIIVGRAR